MMRIKSVEFNRPIRIVHPGSSVLSTHANSERFDIFLYEFKFIEIRQKDTSTILAIVPFANAAYVVPEATEKFDELDTADIGFDSLEHDAAPLMAVNARVKSKAHARSGN